MNNKWHTDPYKPVFLFLILASLILAACQHMQAGSQGENSQAHDIKKIALIGFKSSVYQGDETDDAPGDLSRDSIPSDTALLEKSYFLTSRLSEAMGAHKAYELISPDSARGVMSRIADSEPGVSNAEIAGRVARELQADAAVIGCLYRWKDREGSDYAVSSPASVFFDLCLVSPDNGTILWKGRFNKTQRSLNQNLLDIRTFLKGKGKWMTAEGLAGLGLNDLVDDMFIFMDKGKEAGN